MKTSASDTLNKYAIELQEYRDATKEFWRIKNGIHPITPTAAERFALFEAKETYSAACKKYHAARNVFIAECRRVAPKAIAESDTSVQMAMENALHSEVADSPMYDEIRKAARELMEKKQHVSTDNVDAFTDIDDTVPQQPKETKKDKELSETEQIAAFASMKPKQGE